MTDQDTADSPAIDGGERAREFREVARRVLMKRRSLLIACFLFAAFAGTSGISHTAENMYLCSSASDFYLGPEDVLEISVWRDEALSRQVIVRPDGKISFPLVGDMTAQGKTVDELRKDVEEKIKAYVPDTPVTVMVVKLGSPKVYVVGKVARPGVYLMGQPLTVMQALAMGGGTVTFADTEDILVIRKEKGQQTTYKFDYGKVSSGKDLDQNIWLKPGDTVVVP
jgi:polysaccharide export outer membrane protein